MKDSWERMEAKTVLGRSALLNSQAFGGHRQMPGSVL